MTDSTSRDGSVTRSSAASESVIEWASVNAVTTHSTSRAAAPKRSTSRHCRPFRTSTAGNRRASRKRTWSMPIQMCQPPLDQVMPQPGQARSALGSKAAGAITTPCARRVLGTEFRRGVLMSKLSSILVAATIATVSAGAFAAAHGGAMKDEKK